MEDITIHTKPDHKHNENSPEDDHEIWKSCCFALDKNFCVFFSQVLILFAIAVFCMFSIATRSTCDVPVFIGILSTILGIMTPSPSMNKKDKH